MAKRKNNNRKDQLETIVFIIAIISAGAVIFAHSVYLQNNVNDLVQKNKITTTKIKKTEDSITNLKSEFGSINKGIDNNKNNTKFLKEEITKLRMSLRDETIKSQESFKNEIRRTQELLKSASDQTIAILKETLSNK